VRSWRWSTILAKAPRAIPAAVVLLVLLDPFPFLRLLRFDLEVPSLRLWELAHNAAPLLASDERLFLLLPGDNGSVAPALEGVLRYAPPRRPDIDLAISDDPKAALPAARDRRVLLSCAPFDMDGARAGAAALLAPEVSGWKTEHQWSYTPVRPGSHWSQVIAPAPLCLSG
jgi:hypothetical protein